MILEPARIESPHCQIREMPRKVVSRPEAFRDVHLESAETRSRWSRWQWSRIILLQFKF